MNWITLNARVASASSIIINLLFFLRIDQGGLRVIVRGNGLGSKRLGGTAGNLAIFNATLDHPVRIIRSSHNSSSAIHAEVKVTVITYTTMVVIIVD